MVSNEAGRGWSLYQDLTDTVQQLPGADISEVQPDAAVILQRIKQSPLPHLPSPYLKTVSHLQRDQVFKATGTLNLSQK